MFCSICRHCGLCSGQKTLKENTAVMQDSDFKFDKNFSYEVSDIGIAIDIGTTTLAFASYFLQSGEKILFFGQENKQRAFGADLISRIESASGESGLKKMHSLVLSQIEDACKKILFEAQNKYKFSSIKKIVLTGNTAMLEIASGLSVKGLRIFPFYCENKFGISVSAFSFFGEETFFDKNCEVYIAPVIAPFAGGDLTCAILNVLEKTQKDFLLADMGTNSENAYFDSKNKKIICTSSPAGPVFEQNSGNYFACEIFSAVSDFYMRGLIDSSGYIVCGKNELVSKNGVHMNQKDIRNFQLAKAAIRVSLERLTSLKVPLYIAGGFGYFLDKNDALITGLISEKHKNIFSIGNAALGGAILLLMKENLKDKAKKIAESSVYIDMALEDGFQKKYIECLDFPKLK